MITGTASKISRCIKTIEETPQWLIDNLHLKEGYRVGYTCIKSNIKSLFHKHNDVMNIWTHLVGALFFFCFLIYLLVNSTYSASLYGELKRDIKELSLSEKLQRSYSMNISPMIDSLKNYGEQIGLVRLSKLKDQMILKFNLVENDYLEVLNDLSLTISQCKLTFFNKFEVQCERVVQNLNILKTNFVNKLIELKDVSLQTFKEAADKIEAHLHVDYFLQRVGMAFQIDLEVYPIAIFVISVIVCLRFFKYISYILCNVS